MNIAPYLKAVDEAAAFYWGFRTKAAIRQGTASGQRDSGERAAVTSGGHLDGFLVLCQDIIKDAVGADCKFHVGKSAPTLPGFFRATKCWDLVAIHKGQLIAVIELKSQAGPSFGNNFNNRTEEVLGSATDFWKAFREEAFGKQTRPFLGWLMLVEDCPESRRPVRVNSPLFKEFPEFHNTSYAGRYDLLCSRMILENLYSHACLVMSARDGSSTSSISTQTSAESFLRSLYGAMVSFS